MGNCLFGGLGDGVIKVITSSGGIMEFYAPITAGSISNELPGHAIFRSQDLFWTPLPLHEELLPGHSYYLLPINDTKLGDQQIVRQGHVRSKSIPTNSLVAAPYRMSFDCQRTLKRSYTEAFSGFGDNNGFWKVKLVISPVQLLEILSQEGRTQELIQNVRAVAKCGNATISSSSTSSSAAFSDQWSLASSMNCSSKKDDLLDI